MTMNPPTPNLIQRLRLVDWKDKRVIASIVVVSCCCLTAMGYAWRSGVQTTDNAQVFCNILPVPALVSGQVRKIRFKDNDMIKANDVLAEIAPEVYRARLAQAEADLEAAKMALASATAEADFIAANARGSAGLARITAGVNEAGVGASTMSAEQAKAEVQARTISLEQAERQEKRFAELHKSRLVSSEAYENARDQLEVERANLREAQAKLESTQRQRDATVAQLSEARHRAALAQRTQQPQIERAQAELKLATARMQAALAARDLAAQNFAYTRIVAQQGGVVSNRRVTEGQMVEVGQPVASVVTCAESAWVDANFKETQVERMYKGQPVSIVIDAYPNTPFRGVIEGMSGATGARFSLLPPENATGNFTKVVQRVPVRIRLERAPGVTLVAGMSAQVTVRE